MFRLVQLFQTGIEGVERDPARALNAAEQAYNLWLHLNKPERKDSLDEHPPPCKLPTLDNLAMQAHELMAVAAELTQEVGQPEGGRSAAEWFSVSQGSTSPAGTPPTQQSTPYTSTQPGSKMAQTGPIYPNHNLILYWTPPI